MNNGNYKKKLIRDIIRDIIIAEETKKVAAGLGHFNHIVPICLKRGLTAKACVEVYEGVLRNVMKFCDSYLKNSHSIKERYENEIAKASALALRTDKNETESLPWTMPE